MKAPLLKVDELASIRRAAARHPRLYVSSGDRETILARTRSGPCREMAERLRMKCEAYLDRSHAQYLDLEALDSDGLFLPPAEYVLGRIMNELSFAGWLWNEPRYTQRAKQIVLRRAREAFKTAAGTDPNFSHCRSPLGIHLTGHPLAFTFDLLRPALSDAECSDVVAHVREYYLAYARRPFFENARLHSPGFNKTVLGMCSIGVLALAVAEHLPDDELDAAVSESIRSAYGYAREALDDDGGAYEGPGYGGVCIGAVLHLGEALRRHGLDGLSRYEPLFQHALWLSALLAPGGGTLSLGDSTGPENVHAAILLLAEWRNDPGLRWAYRQGLGRPDHRAGPYGDSFELWWSTLPEQLLWFNPQAPAARPDRVGRPPAHHAGGYGMVALRSGWTEDSVIAVLAGCGRRHTAAAHLGAEAGALALWAHGQELLFDPGYWYATTDGHSTVQVSGRPAELDRGGGNATFGGRSVRFANAGFAGLGGVDVSQMLDCRWAMRDMILLRGARPYVIVADDLNYRSDWASYDWSWQASARAEIGTPGKDGWSRIQNGGAILDLASFAPPPGTYPKPHECTWFAERHRPVCYAKPDTGVEAQRLRMHMDSYNGLLVTVLVPRRPDQPPMTVRRADCPHPGIALEVEAEEFKDTIVFAPYNRFLQSGPCRGSGRLAVVREQDGRAVAHVLVEGYELWWRETPLVAPRPRAGEVIEGPEPASS